MLQINIGRFGFAYTQLYKEMRFSIRNATEYLISCQIAFEFSTQYSVDKWKKKKKTLKKIESELRQKRIHHSSTILILFFFSFDYMNDSYV